MEPDVDVEDLRVQVLQDTLQQTSLQAADGAAECCVICLGDLDERCEATPCQHSSFDFLCLVTWLQHRVTCPLCKSVVRQVRHGMNEDGKYDMVYEVPTPVHGQAGEGRGTSGGNVPGQSGNHHSRPARESPYESEAVRRRRSIYLRKLYSMHVGFNRRQPIGSSYTELSPQCFMTDPELVSRARMWLRRELCVFDFLDTADDQPSNPQPVHRRRPTKSEFLLEYIIAILKVMDIQGSAGQAESMIQEFLGLDNTRLFLHELRGWLRSPCRSLSEWDSIVQYGDEGSRSGGRNHNTDVSGSLLS